MAFYNSMAIFYQEDLKKRIGVDVYDRLNKEADKEVSLSLKMPLLDRDRRERYYRQRFLLNALLSECESFEQRGLKISPLDIVNILFRCKLLFAVKDKEEYTQRVGGFSLSDESGLVIDWQERTKGIDSVISRYLERVDGFPRKRTLITEISHFNSGGSTSSANLQDFFEGLFEKMNVPFVCFFDDDRLIERHKEMEPGLKNYTEESAKRFFCAPSIGFTTYGSKIYSYWCSSAWLRTFLNILRIAGFIRPPQIDFGESNIELVAPTSPVFLGSSSLGILCWDEDTKRPWEKIPDGRLFLSFGYRGLSRMWLDGRSFGSIGRLFAESRPIFEQLKNPWARQNISDIAPSLDILSSATQIPDLGAKILLIYCCLEHLFVPKAIKADNKKYIVGGINALKPELLSWFDRLYNLRCDYAHKGYVIRSDELRKLVFESMRNVFSLLVTKLGISGV